MAEDFRSAVEDGLRLSKRIYFGNERTAAVAPPKPPPAMDRSASNSYLPTCPMLYGVIINPEIVDNPDMPSYQPYVHGKLDPPALMPLQMNRVSMEVDCVMDTAFVTVSGSWRVHCVMGSRSCDCLLAVPMGEQGSILGVEVQLPMRSYSTQIAATSNQIEVNSKKGNGNHKDKAAKIEDEPYLTPHIFTLTIPKIDGGMNLSLKLTWSQKLIHHEGGQFTLHIPFSFPEYVTPAVKKICKHERIQINVNPGPGMEILCTKPSHPMKELPRESGKWGYIYDADVLSWSSYDCVFTYTVSSSNSSGTVFLSPPRSPEVDGRAMFCCYLFPWMMKQNEKAFRREVVFVVDISGSMKGKVLDDTKKALLAALEKLAPEDSFNVIAFNSESHLFSSGLRRVSQQHVEEANQWINENFIPDGGTNILLPLDLAMEMFSDSSTSTTPILFFITDGSVENERQICDKMKNHLTDRKNAIPRVYTLGIGSFCNHHFLRKLALLSGGHHDAVHYADSIEEQMGRLFDRACSIFLTDITFENLDKLLDVEVFPSRIPDLSSRTRPVIVSGRYRGTFPKTLKVRGALSDESSISIELEVREADEEIPISKMLAKHEIEILTTEAWYLDSQELKKKIADMSVQNALISEYTDMILLETIRRKTKADKTTVASKQKVSSKVVDSHGVEEPKPQKILVLRNIGIGFGNLVATTENIPSGCGGHYASLEAKRRRSRCCGKLCNYCCGMACIQVCSKINDQLAIALTQLCCGFTCWGCFECWSDASCCCS